jgi:hypothetical protein
MGAVICVMFATRMIAEFVVIIFVHFVCKVHRDNAGYIYIIYVNNFHITTQVMKKHLADIYRFYFVCFQSMVSRVIGESSSVLGSSLSMFFSA